MKAVRVASVLAALLLLTGPALAQPVAKIAVSASGAIALDGMSTKPDFPDYVDERGVSRPRK